MLTETELIVLGAVRYSDNASIVSTYSECFGALSFKCIRSASRRRGQANAFFIPLSILRVTLDYLPNRGIQMPREQEIIHRPLRPSIEPVANAVALFTVELLTRLLRSSGADSAMYSYLRDEIKGLERFSDRGISSFHLRLMAGLLHYLGILPQSETYRPGSLLDFSEGSFRLSWGPEEQGKAYASALLYQFISTPAPEELPLTGQERNLLLQLLLDFLAYHFPDLGTLQSPEILSQLF
ncbi:DNA repair protein RecO [Chlamydia trachomatis]|nr:DNA repair protein RecO [Chlamydia trachomatis]